MNGTRAAVAAVLLCWAAVVFPLAGGAQAGGAGGAGEAGEAAFGWEPFFTPSTLNLYGVYGGASRAIAVGAGGAALVFDGARWNLVPTPTTLPLQAVWAASSGELFAVGASGNIFRFGRDGETAERMLSGTALMLRAVWGRRADDVYAAGDNGTILHFDGVRWSRQPVPTVHRLRGVDGVFRGPVFAVGDNGKVFHSTGGEWTLMQTGTAYNLYAVWALAPDAVFAVGDGGTVLHFDGVAWSRMDTPTTASLYGVWGTSGARVFAVGARGTIIRFDGRGWQLGHLDTWANLNAITNGLVVGDGGVAFHNRQLYPEAGGLRVTEIDALRGEVEVTNTGPAFVSGDHPLCHRGDCDALIPVGTPFAAGGIDVFAVPGLNRANGDLWLFRAIPFDDPENVIHGLQYGDKPDLGSTGVAVEAGKWPGVDASTPAAPFRSTIAFDGFGHSPADWYIDETPTMGSANVTTPATVAKSLEYPLGAQSFEGVSLGDEVVAIREWSIRAGGAPRGVFTSHVVSDVNGAPGGPDGSTRWVRIRDQDPAGPVNRLFTPAIKAQPDDTFYRWSLRVAVEEPTPPAGRAPRLMVQHEVRTGILETHFLDMWGVQFGADSIYLVVDEAGGDGASAALDAIGVSDWLPIALDVDLDEARVSAFIDGVFRGELPIAPVEATDPAVYRLSYDGDGPGNVGTTLLDFVEVNALAPETVDPGDAEPPAIERLVVMPKHGDAYLTWHLSGDGGVEGFKVYRRGEDEARESVVSGVGLLPAGTRMFVDGDVTAWHTYHYRVTAVTADGTEAASKTESVRMRATAYAMSRGQPNPFSVSTSFHYTLPRAAPVEVRVYDVRGALVATLEDGFRGEGVHTVSWGGRDDGGNLVSGGAYFVRFRSSGAEFSRKVVVVR